MPSKQAIRAALPALAAQVHARPIIAVFGGTSGIGEAIARKLVGLTQDPELHLIGRNARAAERIITDLRQTKPAGKYLFHA